MTSRSPAEEDMRSARSTTELKPRASLLPYYRTRPAVRQATSRPWGWPASHGTRQGRRGRGLLGPCPGQVDSSALAGRKLSTQPNPAQPTRPAYPLYTTQAGACRVVHADMAVAQLIPACLTSPSTMQLTRIPSMYGPMLGSLGRSPRAPEPRSPGAPEPRSPGAPKPRSTCQKGPYGRTVPAKR